MNVHVFEVVHTEKRDGLPDLVTVDWIGRFGSIDDAERLVGSYRPDHGRLFEMPVSEVHFEQLYPDPAEKGPARGPCECRNCQAR